MPNGKPGDHPLTDIVVHRLPTFGPEADELIRRIAALGGMAELSRDLHLWADGADVAGLRRLHARLQRERGADGAGDAAS